MSAHSGPSGAVNQCPPPDTTFVWIYFPPDTYALCAAVSGATIKTVSCRTPANHSPSGVRPAGPCHPRPLRSPSCWPLSPTAPPESAQRGPCHHRPDWNLSCLTRHCLRISPGHAARTETGWRCPSGHRFTHSPWHRSAKRAGGTGLQFPPAWGVPARTPIYRHVWCVSALSHPFGSRVLYLCRSSFRYGFWQPLSLT